MTVEGQKIGSIRLGEPLAEGGMGLVYSGFDEKLQREVAVKAIRGDRLDAETRARLLYEARALSQLEHPNICRVYDYLEGDESDYLVLELVRGLDLRRALLQGLAPARGLRIAEDIARALAAAHAKGIVHRDLKLDNVMLTDNGEVKVLDFGLARALDSDEEEPPLPRADAPEKPAGVSSAAWVPSTYHQTVVGAVVGTLTSMSPEQARGEAATAASDLYALGLLMQELLTGEPPYEPGLTRHLLRVKASEGDSRPVHGLDPDTTVLIERLKSLSPEARPRAVEVIERLRWIRGKPARRRRKIGFAALILAAILAVFKYTVDLRNERQLALAARDEAEEVTELLIDLFAVSDPGTARGQTITAREVLERGAERLDAELADRPAIKARLLETIGTVYRKLGLFDQAATQLEQALDLRRRVFGEESLEFATTLQNLGELENSRGRYAVAEELFRRALELRQRFLGEAHLLVAQTLNSLAANQGVQGHPEEGLPLLERALEIRRETLGDEHPDVASTLQLLGSVHGSMGSKLESQRFFERALSLRERILPSDHPDLAFSLTGLGVAYQRLGKVAEAEPLFARALAIQEKVLGPDHVNISHSLLNLASVFTAQDKPAEAESLLRRALAIRERVFGAGHPRVALVLSALTRATFKQGKKDQADAFFKRQLELLEGAYGPDHAALTEALRTYAAWCYEDGDAAQATALFERARDATTARLAADPEDLGERHRLANILLSLGEVRRLAGDQDGAIGHWRRARDLAAELAAGSEDLDLLGTYATALLCLEEIEKARPLVTRLVEGGWRQPDFLDLARRHGLIGPDL